MAAISIPDQYEPVFATRTARSGPTYYTEGDQVAPPKFPMALVLTVCLLCGFGGYFGTEVVTAGLTTAPSRVHVNVGAGPSPGVHKPEQPGLARKRYSPQLPIGPSAVPIQQKATSIIRRETKARPISSSQEEFAPDRSPGEDLFAPQQVQSGLKWTLATLGLILSGAALSMFARRKTETERLALLAVSQQTKTPVSVRVAGALLPDAVKGEIPNKIESGFLKAEDKETLTSDRGFCYIGEGPQAYNPGMLEETAKQRPFQVLARFIQVGFTLGKFLLTLKLDDIRGFGRKMDAARAKQCRVMLTELGPCYIKLGQTLANRPDILREDFLSELLELQDNVPSFSSVEAFKIIEEELGQPVDNLFTYESATPVAAASLGQCYKMKLRSNGEEVAVKVQRPNLRDSLAVDMYLFRCLAKLVNGWFIKNLGCNVTLVVDEFGSKLWQEIDYNAEARNARAFYENFKGDPDVKIPEVYFPFTNTRVITMEWIDGVKCTDAEGFVAAGVDPDRFIKVGVQAGLRQLLEFGLFHGDPHPGNLFAMRDGRIAYIDFGNVADLSQSSKETLVGAIVHVANDDYAGIAQDFINLGFLNPAVDVRPIIPAMEIIWKDAMGQSIADFNFRTVTGSFSKLVNQYPIRIPERYALVIRSLLMQEGICLSLNPKFSILEVALPYVSKRLLEDPNPGLRSQLINIAFKDGVFQWERIESLIETAIQSGGLNIEDTATSAIDVMVKEGGDNFRQIIVEAMVAEERIHVDELLRIWNLVKDDVSPSLVERLVRRLMSNLGYLEGDFLVVPGTAVRLPLPTLLQGLWRFPVPVQQTAMSLPGGVTIPVPSIPVPGLPLPPQNGSK